MAVSTEEGWVVLGNRSTWRGLTSSSSRLAIVTFFWIPLAASQLARILVVDKPMALIIGLAVVILLIASFFVTSRVLLHRQVRVNMQHAEIAVGKRIIPFSSVNRATVGYELQRRTLSVLLMFGEENQPMASVCLKSAVTPELDAAQRNLVADLLRQSAVALPTAKPDPYDPKGKFAWMDRPNSLTRDEAIEFVLHTPESGEPVRQERRPASGFDD